MISRATTATITLLALIVTSAQDSPGVSVPQDLPDDLRSAHQSFVELCAPCHGVLGDGKGTAKLDRPARSFAEGGFSFGNTLDALQRTLRSGIPGTPMPAFGGQVSDERLLELARLVQFLGPEGELPPPKGTVLVVGERPLVVRGKFPALEGEESEVLRGLLIGEPSGMSFQYAADDVRLLCVRLGGFVDRADWGGRGGSALVPLGKVIHSPRDPERPGTWRRSGGEYLRARLRATTTAGGIARIEYDLVEPGGAVLASCVETPRMLSTAHGSGYALAYEITPRSSALVTVYPFTGPTSQSWTLNGGGDEDTGSLATGRVRCNRPEGRTGTELRLLTYAPGVVVVERGVELKVRRGQVLRFEVGVVFLTEWSNENALRVLRGVTHGDD